jgi:hypothetical protein
MVMLYGQIYLVNMNYISGLIFFLYGLLYFKIKTKKWYFIHSIGLTVLFAVFYITDVFIVRNNLNWISLTIFTSVIFASVLLTLKVPDKFK